MIVLEVSGRGEVEVEHSLRVGREPDWADLILDHPRVSRHHMEIRPLAGRYRVWDLGSPNATEVNGRRVGSSGRSLEEGDRITIGGVVELRVLTITPVASSPTTVTGPSATRLAVYLQKDLFVTEYIARGERVRDTMPFQLGLALSLLAVYRRDGLGPVPDIDLRAVVWRGDPKLSVRGDINHLLHRLRGWFRTRSVEPPTISRPTRSATTELDLPPSSLTIEPEDWLYQYLDVD